MAELKPLICKSSGCHYFDGFGCTRSGVVGDNDEKMPCDKGERTMKVGDKVLVPVEVVGMSGGDTIRVEHNNCGSDFWVVDSDVQTVTAEEYRNALSEFYGMDVKERTEIWGCSLLRYAIDIPAEEFVCKLRKHQDEPKTGQIWKTTTGKKIVVLKADDHEVRYYLPSGNESWFGRDYFESAFRNTGEVLTSIDAFLKDLEGLNEEG